MLYEPDKREPRPAVQPVQVYHSVTPDRLDLYAGPQGACQSRALQPVPEYRIRSALSPVLLVVRSLQALGPSNAQDTGEFVTNMATSELRDAVDVAAEPVEASINVVRKLPVWK